MVKGPPKSWTKKAAASPPVAAPPSESKSDLPVDDLDNAVYTRKLLLQVLDAADEKSARKGSADSATTAATRGRQDSADPADEPGMPRLAPAERENTEVRPVRHRAGMARNTRKDTEKKEDAPFTNTYEAAMPFSAFPPHMMYSPYGYFMPTQDAHNYATQVAMAQRAAMSRWGPEHSEFKQSSRLKKQLEYYFSEKNVAGDIFLRSLMDAEGWVPIEKLLEFPMVRKLQADVSLTVKTLTDSTVVEVSTDQQHVRICDAKLRELYPKMVPAAQDDSAESK